MELLYPVVAGLDVHRDTVVVTIRKAQGRPKAWTETRTFSTFADGLQALSAWLDEHAVPLVAIESTGVMWKPVYRPLCQPGSRTVWLVNPMHCKAVPGRKTDVKDSEWLAQLAQFGLVMPSFVPGDAQLQLRELVRLRKQLVNEHSRQTNRIVRDLESQGIKLSSVLSDVLGKSGYAMVKALLAGDMSPEQIADLAVGKLRCKLGVNVRPPWRGYQAPLAWSPDHLGVVIRPPWRGRQAPWRGRQTPWRSRQTTLVWSSVTNGVVARPLGVVVRLHWCGRQTTLVWSSDSLAWSPSALAYSSDYIGVVVRPPWHCRQAPWRGRQTPWSGRQTSWRCRQPPLV
ncbi:MAG TPA: transposase [Polyangiaceae bacterium]|nr:transposase [Polyangiaceae bacterium]